MTTKALQDLEAANELAYASLEESLPYWRDRKSPASTQAVSWEHILVCSEIRAGAIVERDEIQLVHDGNGELVPKQGGCPGWHSVYDDHKGALLIGKAWNGDNAAKNVLCNIAADFIESGCALPSRLREYVVEGLRTESHSWRKRRGQDPYANHSRNFYVACAVLAVVKLGFRPTRNRASKLGSGCSIVAQALTRFGIHLSESAVEKIWGQFSQEFLKELSES